ncbi:translocating chain-associated membrane protein 1-like isoform X1 [Styela clava]
MGMPRKKSKSPPIMSHEFVIQNHADIVSCTAIVIILGLLFEATAKISRLFVFLQYGLKQDEEVNEEDDEVIEKFPVDFNRGWFDAFTVIFQMLIVIVVHAVIQEYIIDKMSRKLHLSKTKTSKFNESGQLSMWSAVSAIWAGYCVHQSKLLPNVSALWEEYPHTVLRWENKLFMLIQLAYWLHMFPELYLQKVRKEEISTRIQYYCLYFFFIFAAYFTNFWKLCIVTLALHYPMECLFHVSRMLYFAEKDENAQIGFRVWTFLYPVVRFLILSLTVLVFWFGFGNLAEKGFDPASGNFNSGLIRTSAMAAMCLLQLWLMWRFIQLRFRRQRDQKQAAQALKKKSTPAKAKGGKSKQKKSIESEEDNKVSNGKLKRS